MEQIKQELIAIGKKAKNAKAKLANMSTNDKNKALLAMADALENNKDIILKANSVDIENGEKNGLTKALLDRLLLTEQRIIDIADGLRQVASLPDPIGEVMSGWQRPNGLKIYKTRVPLGVIGIIYEARPNVTVDAIGLCLKSGNVVVLKGGSEAINSNIAVVKIIQDAAREAGVPEGSIQLIEITDRAATGILLKMNDYIDVIIPRGGAGLIQMVVQNSTVPIIETGIGVCHTFVDASADFEMAEKIAINAKTTRPGVCNAMETLLVHESIASQFLPSMIKNFEQHEVEVRGCERTKAICPNAKSATEEDWYTEYLDLIVSVKVVNSVEEAIDHVMTYGTHHSESIITKDYNNAQKFKSEVDAAAVYVNASTRFTDGFEFGFGAEIGISTQKLHTRGPMGLPELTSIKYIVEGSGQIR
ncbi:glutamate-5-semialdehyde dehydrogenase [Selenomonadales bacterium OttesenSCG-928-I06]|nr:glutamate-5-semialdehyde dehydrogenase [Selenomonadales bacterium OttesenSCG-928-I06]